MRAKRSLLSVGSAGAVLLIVLLLFSSIGLSAEKTQQEKGHPKILNIGCIGALTGFAAPGEMPMVQGSQVAEDWINEKGGITIKGEKYRVKLVTEDHKSTAEGAASAATKLVHDQKVKFIIGGVMPFTNIAIRSVTEPAKVLNAGIYNVGTPDEYGLKTPYTFVTMNGTIEGMYTMLDYISQAHREVKKIAVLIPEDGSIPHLQPRIVQIAKDRGMIVADVIGWALDTVDFTPIAKKALARNPDGICMINGWPSMTGGILKVARQLGYTKPIWVTSYQPADDTLKVSGKEASTGFYLQGLLANDPKNPPLVTEIFRRLKAKFGHENIYYSSVGFDNLWMMVQAIEAAQSFDPTVVKNKWEKMSAMKSVWGAAHLGGLKTYGIKHTMSHPIPVISYVNAEPKTMKWMDIITP
ncbi:MAG: ABC transporter substrate-binding protein [Deltaproteobacteria bacterium]|nr:ABC transporter substrate-binding protein [Deltaproteobacteria bacterium]